MPDIKYRIKEITGNQEFLIQRRFIESKAVENPNKF